MFPRSGPKRSALFGVVAVLTMTCGCSRQPPDEGPALVLHQEAREHPSDVTETTSPFRLENRSARPVRIVGFTTICIESCCARVQFAGPVVIQPGETADFVAEFKVAATGPFEAPLEVYLDDGKLRSMPLPLTGTGRPKP